MVLVFYFHVLYKLNIYFIEPFASSTFKNLPSRKRGGYEGGKGMVMPKGKRINTEKILSRQEKQKSTEVSVAFSFHSPEAKQVYLVGEFNHWDSRAIPMRKWNEREWKVTLQLHPGRYEYKYFVDGAWIDYVPGIERVQNSLGTHNLVVFVQKDHGAK